MIIRPELSSEDEPAIHTVHVACFPTDTEARLVDRLRSADRLIISLVAEIAKDVGNAERDDDDDDDDDDEPRRNIIGHVAFSPVTTCEVETRVGVGLAPVAVLPSHRRQGVAAALVQEGLEACREAGHGWAVVLGDPAYYGRFGFQAASTFGLHDEYGGGSAFQATELIRGALPIGAGLVRYAPEFAAV